MKSMTSPVTACMRCFAFVLSFHKEDIINCIIIRSQNTSQTQKRILMNTHNLDNNYPNEHVCPVSRDSNI